MIVLYTQSSLRSSQSLFISFVFSFDGVSLGFNDEFPAKEVDDERNRDQYDEAESDRRAGLETNVDAELRVDTCETTTYSN